MFHPDVVKLFGLLMAAGARPVYTQTVEQARLDYRKKTIIFGGPAAPMAEVASISAPGPGGAIPLRLYRAGGVEGCSPALIYVHGGGWVLGDLDSHDKVCRSIAAQIPCRAVAVDYRLAPEHPFPAAVDDVLSAIGWIAENAPSLGIDRDRLAIGGDSAGGGLAAFACQYARCNGPEFCAQVLIYPSVDTSPSARRWPSRIQNAQVPPLEPATLSWFFSKYLPQGLQIDRLDPRLSPLHAESLAGLPPALVLTAQYDPLRDEGKAYAERLAQSGVTAVYRSFPGQIHGFIEFGGVLTAAREAFAEIGKFLRMHL